MAETKTNPFAELMPIRLPKANRGEPDTVYVGVNGRGFYVKKGQTVNVPKPVYEVLMNSLKAEEEADNYERAREGSKEIGQI